VKARFTTIALYGVAAAAGAAVLLLSFSADASDDDDGGEDFDLELDDVAVQSVSSTPLEPIHKGSLSQMQPWLDQIGNMLASRGVDLDVLTPRELTHLQRESLYAIPPESYWERIVPAAKMFQELREHLGRPLAARAYRPPSYNASAKGAKGSRHMFFEAIDVRDTSGTSEGKRELARAAAELYLNNPESPIGLGIYGKTAPSIHIDGSWRRRTWADTKYWLDKVRSS
jgi:hypothetical protein